MEHVLHERHNLSLPARLALAAAICAFSFGPAFNVPETHADPTIAASPRPESSQIISKPRETATAPDDNTELIVSISALGASTAVLAAPIAGSSSSRSRRENC